ncbi:hypothetical protein E2C01_071843 [Portunus trituberculatus]|uniref:Uncharacterized protein n=1 Tax=Portunus trituberculatus TaxID=210409 RepID=A0A5B7HWC2_PORTR|nr:hypothetical protein [Portunus trituberculatus]
MTAKRKMITMNSLYEESLLYHSSAKHHHQDNMSTPRQSCHKAH